MNTEIVMENIDITQHGNRALELCKGEIPGARPIHHTIQTGDEVLFCGNCGYYHILILISGKASFITDGKSYLHDTRVTFVPATDKDVTVKAVTGVQLLEIQWDILPEDKAMLSEYKTEFPVNILYQDSIQYIDHNKSKKTISRMMIPQRVIPRFSIGSVESVDRDTVRAHAHPMLDQFFFSFPENDMEVIIDDKPIPMKGNVIMHRNHDTGEFLPSRPLMAEVDLHQVDRITGLTDEDKRVCDELAKKFYPIFEALMKKGVKRV